MANGERLIKKAPFRMPHQSASLEGLIGGGLQCRPGEVSLAHNGVLFLDEAAEFKTTVLQSLRVPLEEGKVTLSRAGRHTVFPAQFQLLLASNPCPCGNFGVEDKVCVCPPRSVELYWKKFSSPLLDRIDIRIPVLQRGSCLLSSSDAQCSSSFLRTDIERAVKTQRNRQGKRNARLRPEEIAEYCGMTAEVKDFLSVQSTHLGFSSRAVHSCIKLSRTIADMRGGVNISVEDMNEAVLYRKNEGGGGMLF
jgi:magnesium chelatase family protein